MTTVVDGISPWKKSETTSSKCCEGVAKRSAPRKRSHTPAALSRKRKGPLYLTELLCRNEGWIGVSVARYVYCLAPYFETTNLMTFRKGKLMKLFRVKFHLHVIGKMLGNPPLDTHPFQNPIFEPSNKKYLEILHPIWWNLSCFKKNRDPYSDGQYEFPRHIYELFCFEHVWRIGRFGSKTQNTSSIKQLESSSIQTSSDYSERSLISG